MANQDVNDQTTEKGMEIRSEKRIVPNDAMSDPELEPLFANHFELLQVGTDVYLDIGIVRPADLVRVKQEIEKAPSMSQTITFHVLERVVMSRDGFGRLKASVDLIARIMTEEQRGE